jgi:hypothetical protein
VLKTGERMGATSCRLFGSRCFCLSARFAKLMASPLSRHSLAAKGTPYPSIVDV